MASSSWTNTHSEQKPKTSGTYQSCGLTFANSAAASAGLWATSLWRRSRALKPPTHDGVFMRVEAALPLPIWQASSSDAAPIRRDVLCLFHFPDESSADISLYKHALACSYPFTLHPPVTPRQPGSALLVNTSANKLKGNNAGSKAFKSQQQKRSLCLSSFLFFLFFYLKYSVCPSWKFIAPTRGKGSAIGELSRDKHSNWDENWRHSLQMPVFKGAESHWNVERKLTRSAAVVSLWARVD